MKQAVHTGQRGLHRHLRRVALRHRTMVAQDACRSPCDLATLSESSWFILSHDVMQSSFRLSIHGTNFLFIACEPWPTGGTGHQFLRPLHPLGDVPKVGPWINWSPVLLAPGSAGAPDPLAPGSAGAPDPLAPGSAGAPVPLASESAGYVPKV